MDRRALLSGLWFGPQRFGSRPFGPMIAIGAVVAALLILITAPLPGVETPALALAVACIGLWASGAIAEPVTAVIFFTLAMLLKVAPAQVVFTGFHSAALWLVFGGMVMGVAVRQTGLGGRLAARLSRSFGTSYWGMIAGTCLVGVALGFLLPSSLGRAILLMPIVLGMAARAGFDPGSNGHTGMVMAAAFGCHVPTFAILPANIPNLVLAGAAEALGHPIPGYGDYLLLHFPVLGLVKTAVMIVLIVRLWPDTPRPQPDGAVAGAMSRDEIRLSALLAVALVLWATDVIHHVSPAWVSMGVAALLLLPRFGLIDGRSFGDKINYNSMIYVAGIMGLGAMVESSGLGMRLAGMVLDLLPLSPGHAVGNFAALTALATGIGLVTTLPGVPAVLTPLAARLGEASGLPVETVLMTQVVGFSTPLLPYVSAPMVVAVQLGGERMAAARTLCLALAAVTILVLFPLDFLWWRLLGRL